MRHIPNATYRIQFNHRFGFQAASDILHYLSDLGVGDIYASPVLRAKRGSMHGYDTVNPDQINPEIGTPDEFDLLLEQCAELNMYWLQDIVPNHMSYSIENRWLIDLLENGSNSQYFDFFDIEWNHPHASARQRVLAPFLGDYYQKIIEAGELRLAYNEEGFSINYYDNSLPLKMESYTDILSYRLDKLRNKIGKNNTDMIRYLGALYVLKSLPGTDQIDERYDQIKFVKGILWELYSSNQDIKMFIGENLKIFNGEKDRPESFNMLDQLLGQQYFRLAYWKVANEEINYRRFFNISDLISLKMENENTFNRVHSYILKFIKDSKIHGLRIDHIDGLYDPVNYLRRLRLRAQNSYIVVEKILEQNEQIPEEWPIDGTTGYEFVNMVNGLFVKSENEQYISNIYHTFSKMRQSFEEILADRKRIIIEARLAGEVERLAFLIEKVSSMDRYGIDITMHGLKNALEEMLIWFPIYRTYINAEGISERDEKYIRLVLDLVMHRRPAMKNEFEYIGNLLLQNYSDSYSDEQKTTALDFVMKFQQLTGPLMAKGFEDTALYVYNRLVSLNEVGGNPSHFGIPPEKFHEFIIKRFSQFPDSMNATSTHDTKRGEDTRARINVISEIPGQWEDKLKKWNKMNLQHKLSPDTWPVPTENDEYMLYQNILGTLPDDFIAADSKKIESYIVRIKEYAVKACREAKLQSSWINPNPKYEEGIQYFVEKILTPSDENEFLYDFSEFSKIISEYGIYNSVSQTLIKLTVPGVPDIYQGSELWNLSLVDPDNRSDVDYKLRMDYLKDISENSEAPDFLERLLKSRKSGQIKMYVIYHTLKLRGRHQELFCKGEYIPLESEGEFADNIISFMRILNDKYMVVMVPRFLADIASENQLPIGGEKWKDTAVILPGKYGRLRNLFTGMPVRGDGKIMIGESLSCFPAAVLFNFDK